MEPEEAFRSEELHVGCRNFEELERVHQYPFSFLALLSDRPVLQLLLLTPFPYFPG